ncbi:MAG: aminotransferase class V-fold PLP-dependent enzyme, partial [Bdellovibrionales bacterium]|nr:aminotransferase class V-fold PLP-dependent enzyme [Bdellovibrionales bacterium]
YGWIAEDAVQTARKQVANLIGCHPKEVIFTSGATESNNLALFGYLQKFLKQHQKPHIITTQTEHKAVQQVCKNCESWGAEVTYLNVNSYGEVNIEELKEAIRPNTKLISVIFAQNEIGTINPIEEIAQVAKDNKIIFHTDAAQATGKVDFSVKNLGVDLLSISAHKLYG